MQARLLIVDDEPEVLNSLSRLLKSHFDLHLFDNAKDALNFLKQTHCHLILSDMKLPHMSGAEFLAQAKIISPLSKRIVLTGHADIEEAKEVVNNVNISRYFTKPWKNQELLSGLSEIVGTYKEEQKHKRVLNSLKGSYSQLTLAKQVMNNTIESMLSEHAETNQQKKEISTANSELIGFSVRLINLLVGDETNHNTRIAQQAKLIAKHLGLSKAEQKHVFLAGLYYQVGLASLPEQLKNKTIDKMTFSERQQWVSSVEISADILREVQLLQPAADIVKHIYEHIDGSGLPEQLSGDDIPIGARILSLVIYYDRILLGKVFQFDVSQEEAMIKVQGLVGKLFDIKIVKAFQRLLDSPQKENFEYAISVDKILTGMISSQDVFNHHGSKLLAKNVTITEAMIDALKQYQAIKESPVIIFVKSKIAPNVESKHE